MAIPRVSDVLLRELAAEYRRGLSIRDLALVRGWSYGTTHKFLQVAVGEGLMTMRPRGYARRVT